MRTLPMLVLPEASPPERLITNVRTIMPITSSMIAALRIRVPILPFK